MAIAQVQLGDLEDAAHVPPGSHIIGTQVGNYMWRSPEAHAEAGLGKTSDIFSFGIVVSCERHQNTLGLKSAYFLY